MWEKNRKFYEFERRDGSPPNNFPRRHSRNEYFWEYDHGINPRIFVLLKINGNFKRITKSEKPVYKTEGIISFVQGSAPKD